MSESLPFRGTALTIAGSDSGGGAGIQADLAAFAYFAMFGTTAITAVTAQNPREVTAVSAVPATTVRGQIDAVFAAFQVNAAKTGMLFSREIIEAVAEAWEKVPDTPLVVDPVMVATSGARLLREEACDALRERLLPQAALITPNLPEAEILSGRPLRNSGAVVEAAMEMARRWGTAVLLKGGHAEANEVADILADGESAWRISAPRVAAPTTHGTGCSLSAAVAACLGHGRTVREAVVRGKAFVLGRLRACQQVARNTWVMGMPATLPLDDVTVAPLEGGPSESAGGNRT